MSVLMPEPKNTLLGKDTVYSDRYNPDLLQPILRALGRDAIGDHDFRGTDIWRLYELSWLNEQGIPQTAVGELLVPASTHSIVESKSLKLYAGSFAMTKMSGKDEVAHRMAEDLSSRLGEQVEVRLYDVTAYPGAVRAMPGINLDTLTLSEGDIVNAYETEPAYLKFDENRSETATETFSPIAATAGSTSSASNRSFTTCARRLRRKCLRCTPALPDAAALTSIRSGHQCVTLLTRSFERCVSRFSNS